jgi:hypothetical protein
VVGTKSYDTGRVVDPSGAEQLYRLTAELHERGVLAVGGTDGKSGSQETPSWREMDSNFQFRVK